MCQGTAEDQERGLTTSMLHWANSSLKSFSKKLLGQVHQAPDGLINGPSAQLGTSMVPDTAAAQDAVVITDGAAPAEGPDVASVQLPPASPQPPAAASPFGQLAAMPPVAPAAAPAPALRAPSLRQRSASGRLPALGVLHIPYP